MPELYQTTRGAKVPLGAVVDPQDVREVPTSGRAIGDPWVHVGPGCRVDLDAWPVDRTVVSPVPGRPPEKKAGIGAEIKDKLISRGTLVPVKVELPPDPPIQRTHPEKDIYREDGSVKTIGVRKDEDDSAPRKSAKKGAR